MLSGVFVCRHSVASGLPACLAVLGDGQIHDGLLHLQLDAKHSSQGQWRWEQPAGEPLSICMFPMSRLAMPGRSWATRGSTTSRSRMSRSLAATGASDERAGAQRTGGQTPGSPSQKRRRVWVKGPLGTVGLPGLPSLKRLRRIFQEVVSPQSMLQLEAVFV